MTEGTVVRTRLPRGARSADEPVADPLSRPAAVERGSLPIVIAATFAADALCQPLRFWVETLQIAAAVTLAPYAQILQGLLDPRSQLSFNTGGFNVLLVRPEDWIRDRQSESVATNQQHARSVADELLSAMRVMRSRSSAPTLVFMCPASSTLPSHYRQPFEEIERDLLVRLAEIAHVHCRTHQDLVRLYAPTQHEDLRADSIGHIPYTTEYFIALATLIARRIATLVKPQYKVIAVDCDNTLWKGVCGEDGPHGVELTPAHLEFQRMLVRQHDAGMLLCLCSKNNPEDVEAVFRSRPEMPLREEHLVASRVNWESKSANLRSLAAELQLGLDSFIFVDDSAIECEEVSAHCGCVLALRFPQIAMEIQHFIDHVWAFDRSGLTEEGRQRTAQYRQNRSRERAQEEAPDLQHFLDSLNLEVGIAPMQPYELIRTAELVQRTNQFNLTTIRRRASEIQQLVDAGALQCLVVHVRDRFGDYGLVGALLLRRGALEIDVDTFVLSCRVLGRGVEHRVVSELGRMARQEGRHTVVLRFRRTSRNAPAWTFLGNSCGAFRAMPSGEHAVDEHVFAVPAQYAESLSGSPHTEGEDEERGASAPAAAAETAANCDWHNAAYRLSRLSDIVRAVADSTRKSPTSTPAARTRSTDEEAVASIFGEVLGLDPAAVDGDFFDLGGDSLQAVRVLARIGSVLGLELSLHDFLEGPSVEEVASRLAQAPRSDATIERADRSERLLLSWAQQRLWFIDQLEGGSATYDIPLAVRLRGMLDRTALGAALDALVRRHEILRTVFVKVAGEPVQQIAPDGRFALQFADLSAQPEVEREHSLLAQCQEELAAAFDLATGPLIRGRLLQLGKEDHLLLITMNHMVSDGWSIGVLIRELGLLYQGHQESRAESLPQLPIQFADYAQWQRRRLTSTALTQQLKYWQEHLRGAQELLELPTDRARPPVQSYRGSTITVVVDAELTTGLKALSRDLNVTLAMTLYSAWALLLSRLTGQEDLVIGIPVANRQRTELEGLIGFFVNTLAVRVQLAGLTSVAALLEHAKELMVGAYAHQDAPFEQVVETLQPTRSLSHSPVFQVMFVLHNAPRGVFLVRDLSLEEQDLPLRTAQFDLTLVLREGASGIVGSLNYASDLFDADTIERWVACFKTVLRGMVAAPGRSLRELPLMSHAERTRVVASFNDTWSDYATDKLAHELFEQQVEHTPTSIAVICEGRSLTYAELNNRANQLAWRLQEEGIAPDRLVGICVERSIEMVVGVLGTLKAGGAYVPLDPSYPPDRLQYMLTDSRPAVLLTNARLAPTFRQTITSTIVLDTDQGELTGRPTSNLQRRALGLHAHHLAYVIYTSGSTGQPKGVMVEHGNLLNYLQWARRQYAVPGAHGSLVSSSLSFDATVTSLYLPLLCGQAVTLIPEGEEVEGLERHLRGDRRYSLVKISPAHLGVLGRRFAAQPGPCGVDICVIGGEALPGATVELWGRVASHIRLINEYGPTETVVGCSTFEVPRGWRGSSVSIGQPIANTRMYVLDAFGQPVPVGVAGEIYIGGAGVTRGYLNRPQLTAERFVPDTLGVAPGERMYRTGDLGRWCADGRLDYLGRNDHQVKIRGFRIELGEIEAQLRSHRQVKDAAVLARQDTPCDKRLVAYVVPADWSDQPAVEVLRAHLRTTLPEHMIPAALVVLERLPLTANGKLDRKALPAPELGAYVRREYEAPRGEVERILAGIWQSLLRLERVGRRDSFFELGGHSLLIVQMMERLHRVGLCVGMRRVFETPALADLAAAVTQQELGEVEVPPNLIPPGCELLTPQMLTLVQLDDAHIRRIVSCVPGGTANIEDIYPLAPLQEGILFHHLLNNRGGDTYVVSTLLSVSSREQLERLEVALQAAIDRHAVLRTAVLWEDLPQPVQVVYRRGTLPVEEVALQTINEVQEQVHVWLEFEQQRLELQQAPLIRLKVATDASSGACHVLLQLHHIVGDNTSQETIIAEVVSHIEGRAPRLQKLVPYRNHVTHALAYARRHDAEAFFRQKVGDIDEPTAPFGLLDVHADGRHVREDRREVDSLTAQRLQAQARRMGVSAATLFHAAWALVVAHTSVRGDVVFGSVLLGRLHGNAHAEQILGMFINTLPLRLRIEAATASSLVEQTQRELVELLSHEQASLAVAQRCSGIVGSAPLFTALLNYRHSSRDPQSQWSAARGIRLLAVHDRTNYPIVISVDDFSDGFAVTAQTDSRIDPARLVGYVHAAVLSLVDALERTPEVPALQLSILPDAERREVIELFNATAAAYPQDELIQELFERQVERTPDAIAATFEEQLLTYVELNRRANRWARNLVECGLQIGAYVPVVMARSMSMLVAQLAVLKSGGVYVPIDPNLPAERRDFMIRDCGARLIIGDRERPADLDAADAQWLDCRSVDAICAAQSDADLKLTQVPPPPAYVMYTSGSTGTPKGVVVPHRAVNRLIFNNGYAQIEPDDCVVHHSNPTFDASTFEIWGALLIGARVLIVEHAVVLDAERFATTLQRHGASVMYMSVGLFNQYSTALAKVFQDLRYLLVGGDSLEPTTIRRVLQHSPPHRLLNAYGPTECTTFATTYPIASIAEGVASVPIGRPIANTRVYILNRALQPVPVGVAGEIYIGGAALACGYLNRPELTAERFIPEPFSGELQARMYRTGDVGRWRADGTIEYLGRNDFQVKIRGFRIELAEIEGQLLRHERVKEATVMARQHQDEPGEKRLVAYVVPRDPTQLPGVLDLRAKLSAALPEYMVPSAFVILEQMPLTSTGKLDRRALPVPELSTFSSRSYEPPQGEVEEMLAGIWQSVLNVERVGRHDDFFELGGHSLLMVKIMERLRRVGLATEVRRIFENPTVAALAGVLASEVVEQFAVPAERIPPDCTAITPDMLPLVDLEPTHIERIVQVVPGGAANIRDIYPLAPLQEGILFHHLLDEGKGDTYVLPIVLRLDSRQRLDLLLEALQAVVDRHDVLRTAVWWEQVPRPVQIVYRRARLDIEQLAMDPARPAMEQIAEWIRPERQRIDIRQAPLLRVRAARHPEEEQWYAMLQLHHMTIDHVALEIVISEVVAHMDGRAQALPPSVPYRDHVAQAVAYARRHDAEEFFRSKLGDIDEPTAPFGLLDVHSDGAQIEDAYHVIDSALSQRLRAQARRLGVSAATLFHAAWGIVVAHTSGRDDVVFGTVLLGRLQSSAGAQRTLGMFINTLPLRLQLQDASVAEFVEQTQRELVELLGHEQASLAAAQRCSQIVGSAPLFTALLNYRHSVPNSEAEWSRAYGVSVVGSQERTNYPVTLSVDDTGDAFTLKAQVDRRVAAGRVAEYLCTALSSLASALEEAPQTPVLALSIMPLAEEQQLARFNDTRSAYPHDALIHHLFEEQAQHRPSAMAAIHGNDHISYAELDDKANRLAEYLRSCGIGADDLVGICVERGIDMVIGLLGILKAGGAYVPLDPNYPPERLLYMLNDAAPRVVLTQQRLKKALSGNIAPQIVVLDEPLPSYDAGTSCALPAQQSPESLVYVIYTSGSTGQPKGTAMPHRAVANLIAWQRRTFRGDRPPRVLQFAALSFDVAFQEIFSTLCTGGTLILLDEWIRRDPKALMQLMHECRIERLFVPPMMLQSLAEYSRSESGELPALEDVIVAGEQLHITPEIVSLFKSLAGCRLHNHYGPTETHVVTAFTLPIAVDEWALLPSIGRPIDNTQVHILDARSRPVPVGVIGEIYLGGANVARGYLRRPELNQQRFIIDPFNCKPGARLYKTGDLGRWSEDGTIHYVGRNDGQVKIRGYRVELGEIEAQLAQDPNVKESAVVVREGNAGDKRLVAYVTERLRGGVTSEALAQHLKGVLPDHMVPSVLVILQEFPLTPSGKLDRRALPAPEWQDYGTADYEPPADEVEEAIAGIWRDLLGVERIGRQHNFFELGGHSLLALSALLRINEALGCSLRVVEAYKSPTVHELAARIRGCAAADDLIDLAKEASLDERIAARAAFPGVAVKGVLLTGATGFVGRFLLSQLLQETGAVVYCLVRAQSDERAQARLRAILMKWDLWREEFASRIVALAGDLRQPRLGLSEHNHELACRAVDTIYHCATSMNHLETYQMAKAANVDAAKELLMMATRGTPKLVNYISTLGVFGASAVDAVRIVDEDSPIEDQKHRSSQGYLASKWVAEKVFMDARGRGIPCNIFRLGLVWADGRRGRFDEMQNVYQVLKSCLLSGIGIEGYRYPMPPTPVDYVARAIVFLASRRRGGWGVFHISSPAQVIDGVFERCNLIAGTALQLTTYYDWICHMKRLHQAGRSLPAVPLIEFAFSMDEDTFHAHQRTARSAAHISFDCSRTHMELEAGGIAAPILDDELLHVCVRDMIARDPQLRTHFECMAFAAHERDEDDRDDGEKYGPAWTARHVQRESSGVGGAGSSS